MKKQLCFVIVFLLFLFSLICGCLEVNEKNGNDGLSGENNELGEEYIDIEELMLHPNRYLEDTIVVKGFFIPAGDVLGKKTVYAITKECSIYIDVVDEDDSIPVEMTENVNKYLLMLKEEYIFTGNLGYGDFTAYSNEGEKPSSGLYFRIDSVELVYKDSSNITTLSNIAEHPAAYLNRSITVKAIVDQSISSIKDPGSWTWSIDVITDDVDASLLIPGGEYYFTGILELEKIYSRIPVLDHSSSLYKFIYLIDFRIEKIEPV